MELTLNYPQKRISRIAVSALFFLTGLCFASWASRIPDIQQKLGMSDGQLGGLLLSLPVGSLLSMPVAGWLVSKYGSRNVVMIAGLLYAGVLPTLGLVEHTWQLFPCLILFGFCGNMANIAVNTQAVLVEAMYGRSIMASFHGLWSLAGFTGASIGSGMAAGGIVPYQHFLLIMVMAIIIVGVSIRSAVRQDVKAAEEKTDKGGGIRYLFPWMTRRLLILKTNRGRDFAFSVLRKQILLYMPIIILGVIAFCSMICEGTMFDWSGVYFKKVIHAKEGYIGLGYTAFMSTMAAFRFVADSLTTRFGVKRMLQVSGALTAAGLLIAVTLPFFATAIFGFLLVGAGVSSVVPLVYSTAGRSKTLSPGVSLAAVSTIGYLGFLMGPPLIGFVAQATSLRISFFIIALMGMCIALMSGKIKN
jgi:MFS family permease